MGFVITLIQKPLRSYRVLVDNYHWYTQAFTKGEAIEQVATFYRRNKNPFYVLKDIEEVFHFNPEKVRNFIPYQS